MTTIDDVIAENPRATLPDKRSPLSHRERGFTPLRRQMLLGRNRLRDETPSSVLHAQARAKRGPDVGRGVEHFHPGALGGVGSAIPHHDGAGRAQSVRVPGLTGDIRARQERMVWT